MNACVCMCKCVSECVRVCVCVCGGGVLTNPGGVLEPPAAEAALAAGVLVAVAQVAAVVVHRLRARHAVDLDADTRVGALLAAHTE